MAEIKDDKIINDAFDAFLKSHNIVLPINYGNLGNNNLDDCKQTGYGYTYTAGLYGPFQVITAIGFVIQIKFDNSCLSAKIRAYHAENDRWTPWRTINIKAE